MSVLKSVGVALSLCAVVTAAYAADKQVSYKRDVQPILQASCGECHTPGGKGESKSGLMLDSYQHLMKGTKYGPIVDPGKSINSVLVQVLEGKQVDPSIRMPHGGVKMSEASVQIITTWVNQGAKDN